MKNIAFVTILAGSLVGGIAHAGAGCSGCSYSQTNMTQAAYGKKDIVAKASSKEQFSTLVAAIQAAGLTETLQGEGPYTVFAPTNEAFAALPAGTVESLLQPENKSQLIEILTYHVVPTKVLAADVKAGEAPTVNGEPITITTDNGGVQVNGANVVVTDIITSNGVIHVIDAVILPPTPQQG